MPSEGSQFDLETLEQRLLLSADPAFALTELLDDGAGEPGVAREQRPEDVGVRLGRRHLLLLVQRVAY